MNKEKKLIIVGDSAFAEVAYEYFTHDSPYEVVGFSVEDAYRKKDKLFDLPIVSFESIQSLFPPDEYWIYVAVVYTKLNRLRTRLCQEAKNKGYSLASYVSSRSFIWSNVEIGEHCFIFEDNTVQPFVHIENNVVLWSGNHIGHHSVIRDNCFISSHVVISGFCDIGENCFFGVNSTLGDRVTVGKDCLIGAGAVITKSTEENRIYQGNPAVPGKVPTKRYYKIKE
jgi:sugar O-acyltransferase (sialic acid O-acetyltransferase NeuD family)